MSHQKILAEFLGIDPSQLEAPTYVADPELIKEEAGPPLYDRYWVLVEDVALYITNYPPTSALVVEGHYMWIVLMGNRRVVPAVIRYREGKWTILTTPTLTLSRLYRTLVWAATNAACLSILH